MSGSIDDMPKLRDSDRRVDELALVISAAISGVLMSRPNEFTYHEIVLALQRKAVDWTQRGIRSEHQNEEKAER